jgi:hypothetical protein
MLILIILLKSKMPQRMAGSIGDINGRLRGVGTGLQMADKMHGNRNLYLAGSSGGGFRWQGLAP